jgi:mannose-6-phosphate isomerase-like protein (cupin superfamily)
MTTNLFSRVGPFTICFCLSLMFLMSAASGRAEIRDVLKSADIGGMFAGVTPGKEGPGLLVHSTPAYTIRFDVQAGKPGPYTAHPNADQLLFVRAGTARILIGGELAGAKKSASGELAGESIKNGRTNDLGAGDVVHLPRNTPHRIDPGGGRLEYVRVQVFPAGDNLPPRQGFLSPSRMADVLKKSEIDATFATHSSNQPIHAAPNYTMNYVIYTGRSGPWEAHRGCTDIYFVQTGTATAQLGGDIANPKEEAPGEIRGNGVSGARRHSIGPGDVVLIPRNTAHHMDPAGGKLGYLLLKVWVE